MQKTIFSPGLNAATGTIPVPLTNDMMLHSITQNNNTILKGLISALLKIPPQTISEVRLLNPLDYRNMMDKSIILDIKAILNNAMIINIELQVAVVVDDLKWINRSILYLCRTFDNIGTGEDYENILPSMHISILPKDLFSDAPPEFYACYYLKNVGNGHIYSTNFALHVLYLNHIDLATESDIENDLAYWAEAFLARTWEDLKALALKRPVLKEVAETMYTVSAEQHERTMMEAHQKYVMDHSYLTRKVSKLSAQVVEKVEQLAAKDDQLAVKDEQLVEKDAQLVEKDAQLAEKDEQLVEKDAQLAEKDEQLAEKSDLLISTTAELEHYKHLYAVATGKA